MIIFLYIYNYYKNYKNSSIIINTKLFLFSIDLITITNNEIDNENKKVIVVTGRVHPCIYIYKYNNKYNYNDCYLKKSIFITIYNL